MKRKVLTITAIVIIITIATSLTAFASTQDTGKIEVSTAEPNSFNGQTLSAYQIFTMTGSESTGWFYEIHADFTGFTYDGKTGFNLIDYIYSLEDEAAVHGPSMRTFTEAIAEYIKTNNIQRTGFVDVPERINIWDQYGDDPENPGNWIVLNPACPVVTKATISNLPSGYYFILGTVQKPLKSDEHIANSISIAPFMALASTDNPTQPLLVDPKVSIPVITKGIKSGDNIVNTIPVAVGDEVQVQVKTLIPLNINSFDVFTFNVHVSLRNHLQFVNILEFEQSKLYALIEGSNDKIYPSATTYIIHNPPLSENFYSRVNDRNEPISFSIEFKPEFLKANIGKNIYIEFPVVYNDKVRYDISRFLMNESQAFHLTHAALEYSDNPFDPDSTTFIYDSVNFVTSSISIYKFSGVIDGTRIAIGGDTGVRFGISKESNLQTGTDVDESKLLIFNRVIAEGLFTPDGVQFFNKDLPRYVLALDQESPLSATRVKHLQPDEFGKVYVFGLGYGTFHLYETKAPEGYSQLTAPVEVNISFTDNTSFFRTTVSPNTLVRNLSTAVRLVSAPFEVWEVIAIQNNRASLFPETGGIGTGIFLLIGSIIMVISGMALIIKKKTNKKK